MKYVLLAYVWHAKINAMNDTSVTRHPMRAAARQGLKTSLWLLSIMIPVSFAVTLLQHFGCLAVMADFLQPVCRLAGLRGEAALVWVTAGTMNIYSGIAVIQSLPFTTREITIMALMTLIAHSLIVETVVQRKTGTPAWRVLTIRLVTAMVAGIVLNLMLPADDTPMMHGAAAEGQAFGTVMQGWLWGTISLALKIICIIVSLSILQQFMQDYGIMDRLAAWCAPVMTAMGLSPRTSFLWIVANTIGLSYGASVILDNQQRNTLTRQETDLLNYHIAVCHSLLEDTPMFMAVNASLPWITIPRIVLAVGIVWMYRLMMRLFPRHFREAAQ